ncbi:MAG TPA: stage II sporulation protein M [Bacillales bacterium]|nr:stage II sporulation protein M [Bacillales bacterium]
MQNFRNMVQTHIRDNSSVYTFTMVLLVMGVIFGAVIVNSLAVSEKQDLFIYLKQFFGEVSSGHFASPHAMFNESLTHYLKYIGFMWILGVSIIGLPIILILLFLKGVVVGFTVGFLVNQMGWHGLMLAFVSVLPQNLILVPAFIIVSTASVAFSLKMIRQQFIRKNSTPILPQLFRYSLLVTVVCAILAIVSLFEAYISPVLIKAVVG